MDWIRNFDHSVFFLINHARSDLLDLFFYTLSLLGEYGIVWISLGLILLVLDKKRGKNFFFLLIVSLILTVLVGDVLKLFLFRERPYLALENVYQYGERWKDSAFPSGHSSSAFAGIFLIYIYYKKYFKWALLFGLLVLYSRVYLGMHYPIDVLAGSLIGLACGFLTYYLYQKMYHPKVSLTEKFFNLYNSIDWKKKFIVYGVVNIMLLIWFAIQGKTVGTILVLFIALISLLLYFLFEIIWKYLRRRKVHPLIGNSFLTIFTCFLLVFYVYSLIIGARFSFDNAKITSDDKHLVVMVLDGASLVNAKEIFMEGAGKDKEYLSSMNQAFPNISKYFIQNGAFTPNGISVWPSSSIPAHTGIITGNYPRETGIAGQRQFNAKDRKHTSFIGLGIQMHQYILNKSVKTLCERFENVRSLDVLQVANRGCSLYIPETPHDERVLARSEQMVNVTDAVSKFSGKSEIPKILVMTLPDIDHETHSNDIGGEKSRELYLSADKKVGQIIDLYKEKGLYDKTLFVLAADHGMGTVENHVTLDNLINDMRFNSFQSLKWKAVPAWGNFEANFYVGTKYKFNKDYNAVSLWGGNSDALIYIKGQKKDADNKVTFESWDIKPDDASLKTYKVGGEVINVIDRLFKYSQGIGLIFTNPEQNVFNVYSEKGQSQIVERNNNGLLEFRYDLVEGEDPLDYTNDPALKKYINSGQFLSDQEWLNLSYLSHYPDAIRRISYSFGSDNSATLHLVAKDGWDFTPWYVSNKVLVGSHGSLNADQSLVPIMFHGPGVKQIEMPFARTVDILPTILAYFDRPVDGTQGRALPIFSDEIKNSKLATYDYLNGEEFSCPSGKYFLQSTYGSYDKKLVRITGNDKTVLIPSIKATFSNLDRKVNLSANIEKVECDKGEITFREDYIAENKLGEAFTYNLLK